MDEPNAKKPRPNLTESGGVLPTFKPNKSFSEHQKLSTEGPSNPPSSTSNSSSKTIDSSTFDNVEEELGRLFGSSSPAAHQKKDNSNSKVTISPVKTSSSASNSISGTNCSSGNGKDFAKKQSSPSTLASPSMGNGSIGGGSSQSSSSSGGSVTITKLSTGSTLNVESKDLKSVLSGGGRGHGSNPASSASPSASNTSNRVGTENGLRLKGNIDITALSNGPTTASAAAGGANASGKPLQLSPPGSDAGSIRCNKCNVEYSTKEARRLHTCNSILDQHYLSVENASERTNNSSKSNSGPTSPTSTSNPGASHDATSNNSVNAAGSLSSPSSFDSASSRSNSPMMDQWGGHRNKPSNNNSGNSLKFIKEKSDKLIIEGRPKLSVTKVSRLESDNVKPSKPGSTSGSSTLNPAVPKFKLSATSLSSSSSGSSSSLSNESKKSGSGNGDPKARWSTVDNSSNLTSYSGKLKIKVGGSTTSIQGSDKPSSNEAAGPEGNLAFTFAGKPTYSPSRIEPSNNTSGAVQTKGEQIYFFTNI